MDTAYVVMLATFGASAVLGATVRRNWIVVGLGSLVSVVPYAFTLAHAVKSGAKWSWEGLLFVSPFLIAAALVYALIALLGARLGRRMRQRFARFRSVGDAR